MSTQPPQKPPEGWEPRPQGEGSERPTEPQWPTQGPQWGTQPPQPPEGWGPPPQGAPTQPQWGQQPPQPPPRKRRLSAFLTVAVSLVGILIVAGIIGALAGDPESTSSTQATAAPTSVATTVPPTTIEKPATTAEPVTTAKPPTTAKPKPIPSETLLRNAVVKALGESNRKVKRLPQFSANEGEYIVLTWRINENLTEGLTKSGARLDGMNMLKAIRAVPEHDRYKGVSLKGTYALVDQFGNSSEDTVIRAGYDRSTLEKINFDGIDYKTIFDIADRGSIHPTFQY
jgi:hypothetical protein